MFNAWHHESEKLKAGTITKRNTTLGHYNHPCIEAERLKAELDTRRAEKR